jgi:TonB family protein
MRVMVGAAAIVTLAAAGAIAQTQAPTVVSFNGRVVDQTNREIVGADVTITHARTRVTREARSSATGEFGFDELPVGEYLFEARSSGFAPFRETLRIDAALERTLTLGVAPLQEIVTVLGPRAAQPVPASVPTVGQTTTAAPRNLADCSPEGNVRAPRKVKDVAPAYPAHLAADGVRGDVVLAGVVATDGTIRDLESTSESHADLVAAAIEAIRQWEFEPVLLNCVPIEAPIRVTVRFDVQ